MKRILSLITCAGFTALLLVGITGCGDACTTYCARGSVAENDCVVVEVCDVCGYDNDCCLGLDDPECGIEPYPF